MTHQEVCTTLEEWTEINDDLETCKKKLEAVFCSGGYEFVDMHMLEIFMVNHKVATDEVFKLIGLLSVKKNKCSPTMLVRISGKLRLDLVIMRVNLISKTLCFM